MRKDHINELIDELRMAEHDADEITPGCKLAVLLSQAHRMITTMSIPGPATAKLIRCIKADLEPTDKMIEAFIAEWPDEP